MERQHLHVLITGPGGSGKTTLANYFKFKGKNAVDADLAGIGIWLDKNGNEIKFPKDQSYSKINEWAEENGLSWYWKQDALVELISHFDEVFIMGSARNSFELSQLFDKTYYLSADEQMISERLKRRSERGDAYHDNGKTHEQRIEIVKKIRPKREEARRRGFEFVDASLTAEEIYNIITEK